MENQRILVIGGTGFIGSCLVQKLISSGFDITVMSRSGSLPESLHGCKYIKGDLAETSTLPDKLKNFSLIIDLAAVVRTFNKKRYNDNITGLKNLISAMQQNSITKIVYFSTQHVNVINKGYYSKSKAIAEDILRGSGLDYMIIRPNYVYSIDRQNDFYKMAYLISHYNIAPIIGDGNYRIQPVLREDLVNIVLRLLSHFESKSIIEISGKDTVSIKQAVALISHNLNKKPVHLHIPVSILRIFKLLVPFDIDGYTEDKVSSANYTDYSFSSFADNIKKITELLNKK